MAKPHPILAYENHARQCEKCVYADEQSQADAVTSGTLIPAMAQRKAIAAHCEEGAPLYAAMLAAYNAEVQRGMTVTRYGYWLRIGWLLAGGFAVAQLLHAIPTPTPADYIAAFFVVVSMSILNKWDEWWFLISRWFDPPAGYIR